MFSLGEWELVANRTYKARKIVSTSNWEQIPIQEIDFTKPNCIVRVSNPFAKKSWYFGSKVTLFANDSNKIKLSHYRVSLNELTLISTVRLASKYLLEFWFPWWHEQILIEVWQKASLDDCDICSQLEQVKKIVTDISDYDGV